MKSPELAFVKIGRRTMKKRKRAFLLSLFIPGLGQIYSGRKLTGVTFLLLFLFPFYYLYLIGEIVNYGSSFLFLAQILLYVLQAIDAKRGEKRETSPCEDFCPAGVNVPSFMALSEKGDFKRAVGSFLARAPFPFTLGEICPAPCESKCGVLPERPLKIREVHRELGRILLNSGTVTKRKPFFPLAESRVAVVGGGIAGLTAAYYLASCGVNVSIFEKENALGGLLNLIPDFKLDKGLFRKEIEFATSFENINVFLNRKIKPESLQDFDAVVIATGSQFERKLNIPVNGNPNIIYPINFLRNPPDLQGKELLVIGAGDTAFDIARLGVRLGASVFVMYRGKREGIKAQSKEVAKAIREGVKVLFNCEPKEIRNEEAVFSCGTFRFDVLVPAIGFHKDKGAVELSGKSKKFFIAGDARRGVSTAVEAVNDGRTVAYEILKQLSLEERAWFISDFYFEKPERACGENLFIVSESSLCKHCGKEVEN